MDWSSDRKAPTKEDGYIRLSPTELRNVNFEHLLTTPDIDVVEELRKAGFRVYAAGVTEIQGWSAKGIISVGWVWYAEESDGRCIIAPATVSANIMLSSPDQDWGFLESIRFIEAWIATLPALKDTIFTCGGKP